MPRWITASIPYLQEGSQIFKKMAPSELAHMTDLEMVIARLWGLRVLEAREWLSYEFRKSKLWYIRIDFSQIPEIPTPSMTAQDRFFFWDAVCRALAAFRHLTGVHFRYCPKLDAYSSLGLVSLRRAPKLRQLTIEETEVIHIPPSLLHLPHLTYIRFEKCQITEIPPWITQIKALKSLILENNAITTVPSFSREIKLSISGNLIENLSHLSNVFFEYMGSYSNNPIRTLHGFDPKDLQFSGIEAHNNRSYFRTLAPYYERAFEFQLDEPGAALFRQFLGEYVENHIPVDQKTAHYHELTAFYAQSAMELAQKLLQTGRLEAWEARRLVYEAGWQERQFLEQHLPPTHPILRGITARDPPRIALPEKTLLL